MSAIGRDSVARFVLAAAGLAALGGLPLQEPAAPSREAAVIAAVLRESIRAPKADTVWLARRLGGHRNDLDFRLQRAQLWPGLWQQLASLAERYNGALESVALLTDLPGVDRVVLLVSARTRDPPGAGLHRFTRPVFSAAGDSALVGHMFLCPGLCGSTRVLLLQRRDTTWVVTRSVKHLSY